MSSSAGIIPYQLRAFRIFGGQKMNHQPKKTFRVFGVFRGLKMNAQPKHDALQEVADYKSTLHMGVHSESPLMTVLSITTILSVRI
jgi:hypothetical protein